MTRLARLLPLLTVAAWTITLVLPILDSGTSHGPRIVVSSLGGDVFDLTGARPEFVLAWAGVLGCAASVWLFRSLRWWSVVTMLIALVLGFFLLAMIMDPPSLLWDGVDGQGRPTGGQEIGEPVAGALAWVIGIGALFAAGVCGLIARGHRVTQSTQNPN